MGKLFGSIVLLVGIYFFLTGFVLGGVFGCLLGVLILVVAFRKPTKKCQFCASQIPAEAKVCLRCQRDLAVTPAT